MSNHDDYEDERPNLPVNPFGSGQETQQALVSVAEQREVAEVQAAMAVAKRFPRDAKVAMDRVLMACTRPSLAAAALYSYARGGQDITGPSIRLAEAIAQCWGNLQHGVRELEQREGESTVEAYAWDLETNTRTSKVFQVAHERHKRDGKVTELTDPRDIYELVANQGARRLRSCILATVPGDVIEAAVNQCEVTLRSKADVTPDRLKAMLAEFGKYGVTKEQIEARIQRRLDAMTPALFVQLGKIANSLRDGMSSASDWFQGGVKPATEAPVERAQEPAKPQPASAADERLAVHTPAQAAPAPTAAPPLNVAPPTAPSARMATKRQLELLSKNIPDGKLDQVLAWADIGSLQELEFDTVDAVLAYAKTLK